MEREHQILSYLQNDDKATQRQIASETGFSLGSVNILLKKMIKKGLVKIERLNARSLRYILTPRGLTEKSRLTYTFIKNSYEQIMTLTTAVENVIQKIHPGQSAGIYLYGPHNEVLEVLNLVLSKGKIRHTYIAEASQLPDPSPQTVIIVWDSADEETLSKSYRTVNILKELS